MLKFARYHYEIVIVYCRNIIIIILLFFSYLWDRRWTNVVFSIILWRGITSLSSFSPDSLVEGGCWGQPRRRGKTWPWTSPTTPMTRSPYGYMSRGTLSALASYKHGEGLDFVSYFRVTIALVDVTTTVTPLVLKVVAPFGSDIRLMPAVVLTRWWASPPPLQTCHSPCPRP